MYKELFGSVTQLRPWLHLQHCPRLSTQTALSLVSAVGSAESVLTASTRRLRDVLGNANISAGMLSDSDHSGMEMDLDWFGRSEHHHIVSWGDRRYPYLLREIPAPPLLLYVCGDPEFLVSKQIAIVGSRNPTPAGRALSTRFARNLSRSGLTVTSGLATGVDAAAHEGALAAGHPTIAVMATGPDLIYPRSHRSLARAVGRAGALVTERPVGARPTRQSFPLRNRIISGLSVGTLVIEATQRSGSLITARMAGEQGRDVFAVPGSIHSPLSRGCHSLIRDGACLVESEFDVLSEVGLAADPPPQGTGAETGPDDEGRLVGTAMGYDPVSVDTIVQRSGLTADKVCSILLRLEIQGLVKPVAGGHYMRIR